MATAGLPDKVRYDAVRKMQHTARSWSSRDLLNASEIYVSCVESLRASGYAIVPVEPTEAMVDMGFHPPAEMFESPSGRAEVKAIYRAMISAAG